MQLRISAALFWDVFCRKCNQKICSPSLQTHKMVDKWTKLRIFMANIMGSIILVAPTEAKKSGKILPNVDGMNQAARSWFRWGTKIKWDFWYCIRFQIRMRWYDDIILTYLTIFTRLTEFFFNRVLLLQFFEIICDTLRDSVP